VAAGTHPAGTEIAIVEYNPVVEGELGHDELMEFIAEVQHYRPDTASRWLKNYLSAIKAIYALQLLSGTDEDDGWRAVHEIQSSIWNHSGGILQSDGEVAQCPEVKKEAQDIDSEPRSRACGLGAKSARLRKRQKQLGAKYRDEHRGRYHYRIKLDAICDVSFRARDPPKGNRCQEGYNDERKHRENGRYP